MCLTQEHLFLQLSNLLYFILNMADTAEVDFVRPYNHARDNHVVKMLIGQGVMEGLARANSSGPSHPSPELTSSLLAPAHALRVACAGTGAVRTVQLGSGVRPTPHLPYPSDRLCTNRSPIYGRSRILSKTGIHGAYAAGLGRARHDSAGAVLRPGWHLGV